MGVVSRTVVGDLLVEVESLRARVEELETGIRRLVVADMYDVGTAPVIADLARAVGMHESGPNG